MTEIGDTIPATSSPPEPLKPGDMVVWRNTPHAIWELLLVESDDTCVIWHHATRSARVCNLDRLRPVSKGTA